MSRLDEIKSKRIFCTKDPKKYCESIVIDDLDYLLRIAECAEEFAESFENYSKELGESCITGPEYHCRNLRKAFEGGDDENDYMLD